MTLQTRQGDEQKCTIQSHPTPRDLHSPGRGLGSGLRRHDCVLLFLFWRMKSSISNFNESCQKPTGLSQKAQRQGPRGGRNRDPLVCFGDLSLSLHLSIVKTLGGIRRCRRIENQFFGAGFGVFGWGGSLRQVPSTIHASTSRNSIPTVLLSLKINPHSIGKFGRPPFLPRASFSLSLEE